MCEFIVCVLKTPFHSKQKINESENIQILNGSQINDTEHHEKSYVVCNCL